LRIERWREALLWTWSVSRMGGVDGVWGEKEKEETLRVLGARVGEDEVMVKRRPRKTKDEMPRLLEKAKLAQPKKSWIWFSSFDGHIRPESDPPAENCTISLTQCLPAKLLSSNGPVPAGDVFEHLAFAERACGDCLMEALLAASGDRSLSSFLPDKDVVFHPPEGHDAWPTSEPVLPLTKTWEAGSFGLESVMRPGQDVWPGEESGDAVPGEVNLRKWCIKLLTRYAYATGWTSNELGLVYNPDDLTNKLKEFEEGGKVMTCINDDQPDANDDESKRETRRRFVAWMQEKWGGKGRWSRWERSGAGW